MIKNGIEASDNKYIEIHRNKPNLYKNILVEDFSKGMNRELLEMVFKRSYKANPDFDGYGIDLLIAKSAMERQNGNLLYHKEKNQISINQDL